jgi:hypothetical protein
VDGSACLRTERSTTSFAITRVSLKRVGYNATDEEVHAACTVRNCARVLANA